MQAADVRVWQTSLTEHESFRVLSVIGSLCLSGGMRSSVTGSGLKFVDTLCFSFSLRGITTMNLILVHTEDTLIQPIAMNNNNNNNNKKIKNEKWQ